MLKFSNLCTARGTVNWIQLPSLGVPQELWGHHTSQQFHLSKLLTKPEAGTQRRRNCSRSYNKEEIETASVAFNK